MFVYWSVISNRSSSSSVATQKTNFPPPLIEPWGGHAHAHHASFALLGRPEDSGFQDRLRAQHPRVRRGLSVLSVTKEALVLLQGRPPEAVLRKRAFTVPVTKYPAHSLSSPPSPPGQGLYLLNYKHLKGVVFFLVTFLCLSSGDPDKTLSQYLTPTEKILIDPELGNLHSTSYTHHSNLLVLADSSSCLMEPSTLRILQKNLDPSVL